MIHLGRLQKTILCTRIACWIPKATNTHTQVVQYSLLLHSNNGCTNAPRCCVIRYTCNACLVCVYGLCENAVCTSHCVVSSGAITSIVQQRNSGVGRQILGSLDHTQIDTHTHTLARAVGLL